MRQYKTNIGNKDEIFDNSIFASSKHAASCIISLSALVVLEYGRVIEKNCYSTDTIKIILEI
jgi:hypothetical protein